MQTQVKQVAGVDITEWKMSYDDMELKNQVGNGQFGAVVLAQLNREATSPTVTQYIQKQETPKGFPPTLLVAVKRYNGECAWDKCSYGADVSNTYSMPFIGRISCRSIEP